MSQKPYLRLNLKLQKEFRKLNGTLTIFWRPILLNQWKLCISLKRIKNLGNYCIHFLFEAMFNLLDVVVDAIERLGYLDDQK